MIILYLYTCNCTVNNRLHRFVLTKCYINSFSVLFGLKYYEIKIMAIIKIKIIPISIPSSKVLYDPAIIPYCYTISPKR
jgi:hypothetical protein